MPEITATLKIEERSYNYTIQATDTLTTVRDALVVLGQFESRREGDRIADQRVHSHHSNRESPRTGRRWHRDRRHQLPPPT